VYGVWYSDYWWIAVPGTGWCECMGYGTVTMGGSQYLLQEGVSVWGMVQ
jgi:hypothetical protein